MQSSDELFGIGDFLGQSEFLVLQISGRMPSGNRRHKGRFSAFDIWKSNLPRHL